MDPPPRESGEVRGFHLSLLALWDTELSALKIFSYPNELCKENIEIGNDCLGSLIPQPPNYIRNVARAIDFEARHQERSTPWRVHVQISKQPQWQTLKTKLPVEAQA